MRGSHSINMKRVTLPLILLRSDEVTAAQSALPSKEVPDGNMPAQFIVGDQARAAATDQYPEMQHRAKEEIDRVTGGHRSPALEECVLKLVHSVASRHVDRLLRIPIAAKPR